jgi:hypothetical protein
MPRRIQIEAAGCTVRAELNDTRTATAIWDALPIEARGNTWGDEIYFSIPVRLETERGQETVHLGDLGYWEPGSALCIFYGPTPASRGDDIRPASPVTVFGHCVDDATVFRTVRSGVTVLVTRLDEA